MKKRIIITIAVVLSILLIITILTDGFTRGLLSKRIYRPQNVYEEIWNLVLTEQHTSTKTVLTTGTEDAYVDFDFGVEFVGVYIPECDVVLNWNRNAAKEMELSIMFLSRQDNNAKYVEFIYNYETKILFGNTEFSHLMENFLTDYFAWCEADPDYDSDYCAEDLGEFTFQYANPIYNRELSSRPIGI